MYLYLFIIIIIILVIYGILFRMKNNQMIIAFDKIKIHESFKTQYLNIEQLELYATGNWTSNKSTEFSGLITDQIMIQLKNNNGTVMIDNITYTIDQVINGSIRTNEINNIKYQIQFEEFSNTSLSKNEPYQINKNQPRASVYKINNGKYENPYIIFKLVDGDLTPEVKKIIDYQYTDPIQQGYLYDKKSYETITKFYRFPYRALDMSFENIIELNSNQISIIKDKFNNIFNFQIVHSFEFPNDQTVYSKESQVFNLKPLNEDGLMGSSMICKALKDQLAMNRIYNKFRKIQVYIYFYKVKEYNANYYFANPDIQVKKEDLQLKNNMGESYNDTISVPDLNSVTYERKSNFKPLLFDSFEVTNFSEPKSISLKPILQYLE